MPAIFIFIGALIAATSPASFFRWTGVSILVAAIPALLLSLFVRSVSLWALNFVPYSYSYSDTWSAELNDLVLEKTSWIPVMIVEHLFSPVVAVSGIVCITGLLIFVISFMVRDRIQIRIVERQIVAPAPEAAEKLVESEEKTDEKKTAQKEDTDKELKELKPGSPEFEKTIEPEIESEKSDKKEE